MRLLFGYDAMVAQWVAQEIPHMRPALAASGYGEAFGPMAAIGVIDDEGIIRGGVVYHNHQPDFRNIELSCASQGRRWLTGDILRALLRYPFAQLNCRRLTSVTPRKSDQPRQFLERIGFKREGVVRWGFGNDHAMVYGLLAEEWAKHPYSQPRTARKGAEQHGEVRPETAHPA